MLSSYADLDYHQYALQIDVANNLVLGHVDMMTTIEYSLLKNSIATIADSGQWKIH